jgi:hypothetical protein
MSAARRRREIGSSSIYRKLRFDRGNKRFGLVKRPGRIISADRIASVVRELTQTVNLIEGASVLGVDQPRLNKVLPNALINPECVLIVVSASPMLAASNAACAASNMA